jgi:glycerol-3-phosphate dehydrogenase (NAD(P)+)
MGGEPRTFAGLAGLGDLLATCISHLSRNRYVGEQLGKGRKLNEIVAEMHTVAEGVHTCRVILELAERYGVPIPISREIYRVVHEGSSALEAYRGLVRHPPGFE